MITPLFNLANFYFIFNLELFAGQASDHHHHRTFHSSSVHQLKHIPSTSQPPAPTTQMASPKGQTSTSPLPPPLLLLPFLQKQLTNNPSRPRNSNHSPALASKEATRRRARAPDELLHPAARRAGQVPRVSALDCWRCDAED